GLQAVGNGVSLFPCRKITGVRRTAPAPPKPMTGTPSEASTITGKPGGNDVPTWGPAEATPASAASASVIVTTCTNRNVQPGEVIHRLRGDCVVPALQ